VIKELHNNIAQELISAILVGCSLDKVCYYVTGWELGVLDGNGTEYNIVTAEIQALGIQEWWESVDDPSFSLTDTNEPEDTLVAIAVFTVLNKWPIKFIRLDEQSNLSITFENQCAIRLLSIVDQVDWTWSISNDQKKAIFTCDSGVVYENV